MNGLDYENDEEEVLKGVSMLQQELKIERSLNDGMVKQFEELKIQHDSDNEVTTELRKRIVKLQNDLLEGLSQSNAKRSGEEALMTRLRTMLEKSEAARLQSEYSLLIEQKKYRELIDELDDKEAKCCNEIKKYKDLLKECQNRAKEWEKAVELAEKAASMEKENLDANFEKLKSFIAEKDGVIQFLNFGADEKRKQLEDISKAYDTEQRDHKKTKEKLETCEKVITRQKEGVKQSNLKLAVYEQRDRQHKEEVKQLTEDRNRIENQLQRERGLNIQKSQDYARVEQELINLEKSNKELNDCFIKEQSLREKAESDLEVSKSECNTGKEQKICLEKELQSFTDSNKKTEEDLKERLSEREDHIAHLLSEVEQHQTICSDLAEELHSLQTGMGQIEEQYSKSISAVEQLYCQHFTGSHSLPPLDMVNSIATKLHTLNTNVMNHEIEVEGLRRTIERNESVSGIQKKSIESKSETIKTLQDQLKELSKQEHALQQEHGPLVAMKEALQQQVQDMTILLATEQEKTLTLLKDKKEVIKQKHVSLKEQCETVRHICEALGDKIGDTDWREICRATLHAAHRCVSEKKELNVLLKEAQEEISSCHVTLETLSKAVDVTRVECSRKLAESETVHSDHTKALEDNYLQLVDTLNTKLKVSEVNVQKTNDKIKTFYQENEELKERVSSLEEDVLTCEQRRVNFQAAVGMLGSTVLHHMNSYHRVLHVLSFNKLQARKGEEVSKEISSLSQALSDHDKLKQNPIFVFRKLVITVLAANRMRVLGQGFRLNYMLGVPEGNNPITWLESETLDKLVTNSVRHWRSRPLANTTDKLVAAIYNNTSTLNAEMYSNSLLHKIARGQRTGSRSYTLPNHVLNVRGFILTLTQRLHSVEIERRSLIAKVNHWQKEAKELKGAIEQTGILSRKVQELESMAFETVPISKHEGVMKELATVMSREDCLREEAHNLRQQLKRLEENYEHTCVQLKERSETLDEAIKDLSNQKVQHRQTEQTQRHNTRKIASLDHDKKSLYEQLQTVQKCADTRTRDREMLLCYLSKLQVALQERKIRVTSGNLSSTTGFLSAEAEHNLEVDEVQKICALYEDIVKLTHRRISGLERDVKSFKSHTDSLKGELSAACQRLALEDIPIGKPLVGREPIGKPLVGRELDNNDIFVPLVQRSDREVRELGAKVGQNFSDVIESVMSWS